jgi:transcriptional regulator with GAF, ATPase, and Fis domain
MTKSFDVLQRQRGNLLWAAGLLLLLMSATLVMIVALEDGGRIDLARRWPTLCGLVGMVAVFVLYIQHKHGQLAALENRLRDLAVREATAQARFTELSFLFDISTQLQLRLDLASMLDLAVQRLVSCLDAHQATIMLYDETSETLRVRATAGGDSPLVRDASARPSEGIAGHVFTTGTTVVLSPDVIAERFPNEVKPKRSIASALCVPMRFRGSSIGVVCVTRDSGESFGPMHAKMLEAFAEHCAATVFKTHHHHEMLRQVGRAA